MTQSLLLSNSFSLDLEMFRFEEWIAFRILEFEITTYFERETSSTFDSGESMSALTIFDDCSRFAIIDEIMDFSV